MRLRIRQRMFSWTDSYDVYDEWGKPKYEVRAELLALGHQIHVYQKQTGVEVGSIHQKLLRLLPEFQIVVGGRVEGTVAKELTLFRPRYRVDYRDWQVEGDLLGWDYRVLSQGGQVMSISKEVLNWTDTYVLDFARPEDEMPGLLLVLAIDAANCDND